MESGTSVRGGIRTIKIPEFINGEPIDSFLMEVFYDKTNPHKDIYSPSSPYVIENFKDYATGELVLPFFLNHPCCLDENINLKQA